MNSLVPGSLVPNAAAHAPAGASGPAAIDLSGRERHLRAAMQAMALVASRFSRSARRTLPFMMRQKVRLIPESVAILGPVDEGSEQSGPCFDVLLEAEETPAWARLTLNAPAIYVVLEGSLGARSASAANFESDLTLAQRALVSRVARALAECFVAAVRDEVGMSFSVVSAQVRTQDDPLETPTAHGLRVDAAFTPLPGDAKISIAISAEALELAAREQVEDPGATSDPRMAEAMMSVDVELVAELGRLTLGLRDVLALEVGQVLRLPTAADDPVLIKVGGIQKLAGRPVVSRGQISVSIRGRSSEL